jgi:hypothetical protein
MNENFLVTCGKWSTTETVDRDIFNSGEDAAFEAATRSLERYFKTKSTTERSLTTCVVQSSRAPNNKDDYLIFPPRLYENIGLHLVAEYFKKNKQL